MVERIKQNFARFLAESHLTGNYLGDGIKAQHLAQQAGWETTLCFWEMNRDSPENVAHEYLAALETLGRNGIQSRLSMKLAALQYDVDLVKEIVLKGKELMIPLQFDAEDPAQANEALKLFEHACSLYDNIGYTVPARWDRSLRDAKKIIEMQKTIRIVKGQWNESKISHWQVRSQYLNLVKIAQQGTSFVSIATHDTTLAETAVKMLMANYVPCEVEQMFGLPWYSIMTEEKELVSRRMYIPYGSPTIPYNISFASERFAIVYWILRDCILRREKKIGLLEMAARHGFRKSTLLINEYQIDKYSPLIMEGKQ